MESNPVIDKLPPHLKQFIKPQNYEEYSPIDQAVWRYVMRKNVSYLSKVAHASYKSGLEKTGISVERIPNMYGMNRILKNIGWAAVAVDGFIPPNAFMEFQAHKVLVIASDIRQLEHIEYTPAPDIIHEAAGHAPMIADPDYAEYLRRIGAIGAKAILSAHDNDMYEAIRKLSILKEATDSTEHEIKEAEELVEALQNKKVEPSEMALIRNLHWWTVEYGLIGSMQDPKIYGAGLLSSIGESVSAMKEDVKKIPFSIETTKQEFDITKPQPQLFVTPDFAYLMEVLEDFGNTMAMRKGGSKGMGKLIESKKVGTIELCTGLQISGVFTQMILNDDKEILFFKTTGPTALAYREKELVGHGIENHKDGFSSTLGKLKGATIALEDMSPADLKARGFYDNRPIVFEFESGIKVDGLIVTGVRNDLGKLLLIQFEYCTITYKDEVLFKSENGIYTMAVGKQVVSAFAGAADVLSFPNLYHESQTKTIKISKSEKRIALESLYGKVRTMREYKNVDQPTLETIFESIKKEHANDWLLALEIRELSTNKKFNEVVELYLHQLMEVQPQLKKLIMNGLELITTPM